MKMIGNYMKSKLAAAFLAALSLGAGTAVSAQEAGQDQYRLATELYGHGMFERAGSIFGEIYAGTGDVTPAATRPFAPSGCRRSGTRPWPMNISPRTRIPSSCRRFISTRL